MEATREQEPSISLEDAKVLLPEAVTKAAATVKSCTSSILREHTAGGCVDNPGGYGKPDVVIGVEPPHESGGACGVVKGVEEGKDEIVVVDGEEGGGRDEVVVGGGDGMVGGGGGGGGCVDALEGLVGGEGGEVELEAKEGVSSSPILTKGAV